MTKPAEAISTRVRALQVAVALILLCLTSVALAQGDLYGPESPQDVAWVRILNTTDETVTAWLAGSDLTVEPLAASAYTPVEPGASSIEVQGEPLEFDAEAEQFLTVALTPAGGLIVIDPALRDVSRGLLGLMNLTERPALSLLTPEGDNVVIDVAPGEAEALAISPAQTALLVAEGTDTLVEVDSNLFDRAQAYTVVVLESENGVTTLLLTASAD